MDNEIEIEPVIETEPVEVPEEALSEPVEAPEVAEDPKPGRKKKEALGAADELPAFVRAGETDTYFTIAERYASEFGVMTRDYVAVLVRLNGARIIKPGTRIRIKE
jgi:hypothetical protein